MHQRLALALAYLALAVALVSVSYMVFGPMYVTMEETADADGGHEVKTWRSSAWEEKDPWMILWGAFILIMAGGGTYSIRSGRDMMATGFGLVLLAFSILAMFSIGGMVLPVALLVLLAGMVLKAGKEGGQ